MTNRSRKSRIRAGGNADVSILTAPIIPVYVTATQHITIRSNIEPVGELHWQINLHIRMCWSIGQCECSAIVQEAKCHIIHQMWSESSDRAVALVCIGPSPIPTRMFEVCVAGECECECEWIE